MWPLLEMVAEPDVSMNDKIMYLSLVSHVHNLKLEDENDINFVLEKIETLFSSQFTRFEGLLYLDVLLRQNPTVYVHTWGKIIIPCLQSSDSCISHEFILRILNQVIINFAADKKCTDAFSRYMPDIIPLLLKPEQNDKAFIFYCQTLALCMQKLPHIIGQFEGEIMTFLLKHIDVFSTTASLAIVDCFLALPLCSMHCRKTVKNESFANIWLTLSQKMINTLQVLLNDILPVNEDDASFAKVEPTELLQIEFAPEEKEVSYVMSRVRVISFLCRCLAKMSSLPFRLKLPVQYLLQCVSRIFLLKKKKLLDIPKQTALALCFPVMQNAAFTLLEGLIVNFNILEQCGNFGNLVKDSIEVSKLPLFSPMSIRQLRCSTWKIMNIWLKQYGAKGSYDLVNDKYIILELLQDIECLIPDTNINALQPNDSNVESNTATEDEYNTECCLDALTVLKNIFLCSGSYLNVKPAEIINTCVLKAVQLLQSHSNPLKPFPLPYPNQKCRKKLYGLLLETSLHKEHLQSKHNGQVISAFRLAQKDPSLEVVRISHKAFKHCRSYINPKKPPPEAFVYSKVGRKIVAPPPPSEERINTAWSDGSWEASNGSLPNERVMDMPPPCQIEGVFHSPEDESHNERDLLRPVPGAPSPNRYVEPPLNGQCNDNRNELISDNPPSHSDVGDESESDDDRIYCDEVVASSAVITDIPQLTPQIIHNNSSELQSAIPDSKITELRPLDLEPAVHDPEIVNDKYHDTDAMNCSEEEEELEEEVASATSPKRMTENGMDESGEESSGDEDDEEMDDEDEASECPSEYTPEQTVKRPKIQNDEEHSEEECEGEQSVHQPDVEKDQEIKESQAEEEQQQHEKEGEEDKEMPKRSPSFREMCSDFVFAEPDEIS